MKKEFSNKVLKTSPSFLGWIFVYLRLLTLLMGRLFLKMEVKGLENLKDVKPGGVLFISNHHSYIDPFLIGSSLPRSYLKRIRRIRFMTAERFINKRWYGFLISFVGAYPVYKTGGDYQKSLSTTIDLLRDNQDVLMFPNGKKDIKFDSENAKPGVAYLAKTFNPQIVPVYISDTYKITFSDFFLRRRKIIITFGKKVNKDFMKNSSDYRLHAVKIARYVENLGSRLGETF